MNGSFASILIATALLTAACAPTPPVEAVRLFNDAVSNANTASQPLFDDLATAERRQGQLVAIERAKGEAPEGGIGCERSAYIWQPLGTDRKTGEEIGFMRGFCEKDSPYYSLITDPPATRAFRGGLAVIGHYAAVLSILAEGKNIAAAREQLMALGSTMATLIALAPGGQGVAAAMVPALSAAMPLIESAAKASSYREMVRLVGEAAPEFEKLARQLRAATREMFITLTESLAEERTGERAARDPDYAKELDRRRESYRRAVSEFDMMLRELETTHAGIVQALTQGERPLTLAALADRAVQLRLHAEALRQIYAALRSAGQ